MKMSSTRRVIDAFGGNKKFAEVVGTTPQAVNNWRKANTFPANTYVIITTLLDTAEIAVPDSLFSMRVWRPRRRRSR